MIHDLDIHSLDVNTTTDGTLVELHRQDWDIIQTGREADDTTATPEQESPQMTTAETLFPDTIKAWQRHLEGQVDHLTVPQGQVELAVSDDRPDSPSEGETQSFVLGEQHQLLVRIPKGVWHGIRVLGPNPALVLNFPSELYDYYDPDIERLPADTDEIPFEWE